MDQDTASFNSEASDLAVAIETLLDGKLAGTAGPDAI
jgi:hypothetical protein